MPAFVGMIFGIALTVAGALTYDTLTGRAPNGLSPSATEPRPMVNWNIVTENVHSLRAGLHAMGVELQNGWKKLTG